MPITNYASITITIVHRKGESLGFFLGIFHNYLKSSFFNLNYLYFNLTQMASNYTTIFPVSCLPFFNHFALRVPWKL